MIANAAEGAATDLSFPYSPIHDFAPPVHSHLTMIVNVLALLGLAAQAPAVAQENTSTRQQIVARAKAAVAQDPRCGYAMTPCGIVTYRADSDSPVDREAKSVEAELAAEQWLTPGFAACRALLPPREGMPEVFVIHDLGKVMPPPPPADQRSLLSTVEGWYEAARESCILRMHNECEIWAVYEKAWFADVRPASWFSELAIGRLQGDAKLRSDPKGEVSKQRCRDFGRIPKADLHAYLECVGKPAGKGERFGGSQRWREPAEFLGTFLGHAHRDLKSAFPARWAAMPAIYAECLRAGDAESVAAGKAMAGLDREELAKTMYKWAKMRANK